MPLDIYTSQRKELRKNIVEFKKNRRISLGPYATFYFESYETMLAQVQEMLYIEKGGDEQLKDELTAYNPLIPNGEELIATLMFEIRSILQKFSANGAVIVSDGEDDEMVIPVIQNVIPVVSVQRVVMQVSRTIEHSYAVFGKFLKMVIYDKTYSKFFLGVPGILLITFL